MIRLLEKVAHQLHWLMGTVLGFDRFFVRMWWLLCLWFFYVQCEDQEDTDKCYFVPFYRSKIVVVDLRASTMYPLDLHIDLAEGTGYAQILQVRRQALFAVRDYVLERSKRGATTVQRSEQLASSDRRL